MPNTPTDIRRVPYVNFPAQYAEERDEIIALVDDVFSKGAFVGGGYVDQIEQEIAATVGVKHAIALNSGTDALILAMKGFCIGPGDEVITPANSFVASTAAITAIGAKPVFADVKPDQNIDPDQIEAAITDRTRAIMPVHLTGRVAEMDRIMEIAERHDLKVIEDAAQSFGSRYQDVMSGAIGHAGCFSAHPLKNLNAAGDAGFIVTDDGSLAEYARLLRNHGLKDRETVVTWGTVSRMDNLQAAFLTMRLKQTAGVVEKRRANAQLYRDLLQDSDVFMPPCAQAEFSTFHTFVVQVERRDALRAYLAERGIETAIHYPVPIHLQPAAADLGHKAGDFPATEHQASRIVSLPIHQFLNDDDIRYVATTIKAFYT
jgi:dTDP-4-amino-4,6-dideoxygalactose transaminase